MGILLFVQEIYKLRKSIVLLTGSRGMVGQNILEHTLADQYDFLTPSKIELDLTDPVATYDYIEKHKPDVIIHAAGRVGGIQANVSNPVDFLVTNVDLGKNVILSAYKVGVTKLINLGSSCMYPRQAKNPLKENLILKGELEPTNEGYAISKIFAMRLCEYINRETKVGSGSHLRYKTFIPCNLYGKYDKFEPEHSHLIPAIIYKVHQAHLNGLETVSIWGDGNARREFMYASDLAEAVLRGIEDFDILPDVLNLGLGHDHSINEYYKAVSQVIGWDGNFDHDLRKPIGMKQKMVDISLQSGWGWMPKTSLTSGIQKTYQHYLERLKL